MSHELRTPLNAVIGFSDVLLERMFGDLNERQDEYIRDIRDSGRHLLELINEILDLSKVEAGRMELESAPVSLSAAARARGGDGARAGRARSVSRSSLEVDADIGIVMADELKLKQVVLNLFTNAVKFTPDGGTVAIGARLVRARGVVEPCATPASASPIPSGSGSSRRSSAAGAAPAPAPREPASA